MLLLNQYSIICGLKFHDPTRTLLHNYDVQPNADVNYANFFNGVEAHFSAIPSDVLERLCEIYYWDFALFGYEFPSFC